MGSKVKTNTMNVRESQIVRTKGMHLTNSHSKKCIDKSLLSSNVPIVSWLKEYNRDVTATRKTSIPSQHVHATENMALNHH